MANIRQLMVNLYVVIYAAPWLRDAVRMVSVDAEVKWIV